MHIKFTLNGKITEKEVDPEKVLVDFLREDMKLTGVKKGCEIGECGACTIIMNKQAVSSCMILTGQIHGQELITIEGISDETLHPLQENLIRAGAAQCGFCTPGMIMSLMGLLYQNPNPTEEEIRRSIDGNLCRCTGYNQIIESVQKLNLNEINL